MKIRHINSQEVLTVNPAYEKNHGVYGYVVHTFEGRVLFIYHDGEILCCEDITNQYEAVLP